MDRAASNSERCPYRVLVALASYGTSNDNIYFGSLKNTAPCRFQVDIVVLSNLKKQLGPGYRGFGGLPDRDPWSLPFYHKKVFAERLQKYDIFVYSEDDMLITEQHLNAFLEVSAALREDEIPGFIRIEKGSDGEINYPDFHAHFHWDVASVRSRGEYTLAHFTNEHSACYVLTRDQLKSSHPVGRILGRSHEWKYDLLCSAATDPYTQCGLTKLTPISHLDDFSVHHLSNKYMGNWGSARPEMHTQVNAVLRIAASQCNPKPLFNTETNLWHGMYSKDYYEPFSEEVISMVPPNARNVLSIGCGWGATECSLAGRGLRVVAIPLDSVICSTAAEKGVEMVVGDFLSAREKIRNETFDILLLSNVLHLVPKPIEILSLFRPVLSAEGAVVITSPNMKCAPTIWRRFRNAVRFRHLGNYSLTGYSPLPHRAFVVGARARS